MTARRAGSMARTATSHAPVVASSITRAIVVYSTGANRTPASAASLWLSVNAEPESSPVSRFLLTMTGLPVKRAARSSPRGASSVLMVALGSASRPAQPTRSARPTIPAIVRATLVDTLGFEDVDTDEDDFAGAFVLCPVGHVARLGDHVAGLVLLLVTALPHLGQRSLENVGERRTVLVTVDGRHSAGLERDLPQAQLVTRQIRREIDGADQLRVQSLVVLRRAHLPDRCPDTEADQQRVKPDHEPKRSPCMHVRSPPNVCGGRRAAH